jgi:cytochrome c-type biogenesis protein CcmH
MVAAARSGPSTARLRRSGRGDDDKKSVTPTGAKRSGGALSSWLLSLLLLFTFPALAVEPSEVLSDPALEARARTIGQALRCVVCQNQSIDDSAAEVAHDMRRAVRERLTAGDSNDQVFAFMVARYGDYVLLKPPFKARTLVLWLGAPLLLLIGGGALLLAARRRQRAGLAAPPPLSDEERRRLDALLKR